ncbi:hypothetical protein VB636_00245 [Paracoccus sp. APAP_BH8]
MFGILILGIGLLIIAYARERITFGRPIIEQAGATRSWAPSPGR